MDTEKNIIQMVKLFEGTFKNGRKFNGKFYECENDNEKKIRIENEIINGLNAQNTREYNMKDELIFEGEYLNGVRNGKGKEYCKNGILEFEGEFSNGKRWNGKYIDYYDNGKIAFE